MHVCIRLRQYGCVISNVYPGHPAARPVSVSVTPAAAEDTVANRVLRDLEAALAAKETQLSELNAVAAKRDRMIKALQGMVDGASTMHAACEPCRAAPAPPHACTCRRMHANPHTGHGGKVTLLSLGAELEAKLAAAPKPSGGADDGKKVPRLAVAAGMRRRGL